MAAPSRKQVALLCPNPDTAYIGLVELLLNAIKSLLHAQDRWHEEVARRLALPENIEKRAILQTWQTEEARHFLIIDHGNGFDWRPTGPHTATAEALPSPGR